MQRSGFRGHLDDLANIPIEEYLRFSSGYQHQTDDATAEKKDGGRQGHSRDTDTVRTQAGTRGGDIGEVFPWRRGERERGGVVGAWRNEKRRPEKMRACANSERNGPERCAGEERQIGKRSRIRTGSGDRERRGFAGSRSDDGANIVQNRRCGSVCRIAGTRKKPEAGDDPDYSGQRKAFHFGPSMDLLSGRFESRISGHAFPRPVSFPEFAIRDA
jgi:hypothetical protein